jgi:hypothetical protein
MRCFRACLKSHENIVTRQRASGSSMSKNVSHFAPRHDIESRNLRALQPKSMNFNEKNYLAVRIDCLARLQTETSKKSVVLLCGCGESPRESGTLVASSVLSRTIETANLSKQLFSFFSDSTETRVSCRKPK